jgi:hypothetical protein
LGGRCERQGRGSVELVVKSIQEPQEELLRVLLGTTSELLGVIADELTELCRRFHTIGVAPERAHEASQRTGDGGIARVCLRQRLGSRKRPTRLGVGVNVAELANKIVELVADYADVANETPTREVNRLVLVAEQVIREHVDVSKRLHNSTHKTSVSVIGHSHSAVGFITDLLK